MTKYVVIMTLFLNDFLFCHFFLKLTKKTVIFKKVIMTKYFVIMTFFENDVFFCRFQNSQNVRFLKNHFKKKHQNPQNVLLPFKLTKYDVTFQNHKSGSENQLRYHVKLVVTGFWSRCLTTTAFENTSKQILRCDHQNP